MRRGGIVTQTKPLLIGIVLVLSACTVEPDYGAPAYGYEGYGPAPIYGSLDFDYGSWGGWHHGWDHGQGHETHGAWGHHGFAGHASFGGHGGGGHR